MCGTGQSVELTVRVTALAVSAVAALLRSSGSLTHSIELALVKASPQLASVCPIDERGPQVLSAYRPGITPAGRPGEPFTVATAKTLAGVPPARPPPAGQTGAYIGLSGTVTARSYGIIGQQTLYQGIQSANHTRTAEQVSAVREELRVLQRTVLPTAATVNVRGNPPAGHGHG